MWHIGRTMMVMSSQWKHCSLIGYGKVPKSWPREQVSNQVTTVIDEYSRNHSTCSVQFEIIPCSENEQAEMVDFRFVTSKVSKRSSRKGWSCETLLGSF